MDYSGPERRKLNTDIGDRLIKLETEVESWITNTKEYRERKDRCSELLFKKIDDMSNKLSELPCKERGSFYRDTKAMIVALWVALGGTVAYLYKHVFESK